METADRYQPALLWEKVGQDNHNNTLISPPIEILTRWEKRHEEVTDPNGNTVALSAHVVVDRDVPEGSIMWEGSLEQWNAPGTGSSGTSTDLMEVVIKRTTPDIKNRYVRRTLGLKFYRDTLPQIV